MNIPDASTFQPCLGREFRMVLPDAVTLHAVLAECNEHPRATSNHAQRTAFSLSFRVSAPLPDNFRWATVSLEIDETVMVDTLYVERKISGDPASYLVEAMFS